MRVGIVGYGKMGREVEAVLASRGHEPILVGKGTPFPSTCSVGIDFTRADAVLDNVASAMNAGARYVLGTTGWDERREEVRRIVDQAGGGLVYAANFSIGVNLFYRIVRDGAALLARFPDYDPYVLERHHRLKRDAPSGTAKVLATIIEASGGPRRRHTTALDGALPADAFYVASVRAGGIVGEHTVGFDSGGDEILIEHRARSRRSFALGGVLAAEWIVPRAGFYAFEDVLKDLSGK